MVYDGGNFILSYTDSLGIRRKFTFLQHNLDPEIENIVSIYYDVIDSLQKIQKSTTSLNINTDSITMSYFNLPCMKGIEMSAPPLKSNVKFTPPLSKENKK